MLQLYRNTIHLIQQVGWSRSPATRKQGEVLKAGPDKEELRMRRSNYGPSLWSLAAPTPGNVARSRRWNLVLIAILAFLVLGVFVVAEATREATLRIPQMPR